MKAPDPGAYQEFEPYWRDLVRCHTAMHEAGHAIVARRWGVLKSIVLYGEVKTVEDCVRFGRVFYDRDRLERFPLLRCWLAKAGPIAELWVSDTCGDEQDNKSFAAAAEQVIREDTLGLWNVSSIERAVTDQMQELRPLIETLAEECFRRLKEAPGDMIMTSEQVNDFLAKTIEPAKQ
jgi:hypothetical protein